MTLNCLRCGERYEQGRRRASHFCKPCRVERNKEKTRERMRQLRSEADEQIDVLPLWEQYVKRSEVDELLDELFGEPGRAQRRARLAPGTWVEDRMPPGYKSAKGPAVGMTTGSRELQGLLAERQRIAMGAFDDRDKENPTSAFLVAECAAWWSANAHCFYDLDRPADEVSYRLRAA